MSRLFGVPDTPQRNRNNIPDLLRAMPLKLSVEDEKTCNQTTMRERGSRDLARLRLLIRGMALDWTSSRRKRVEHHSRHGSSTLEKDEWSHQVE